MATEKQIAANQRNASRSTGPKSIEGKAKAARNALKHGLAGHGVILPDETIDQIQDRKEQWRGGYRPDGPEQEWLFERICIESVRADRCLHQVIALRDEEATRASESWDEDRVLEAEELGAAIGRRPELIGPRLLRSKHGALWLVAQWEELERQLDELGAWTDAASDRAMDLLGLHRDGRLGAWASLTGGEAIGVRALIREQVDALQGRLDGYLDDRDDRSRSDAAAGLGPDGADVRRVPAVRIVGAPTPPDLDPRASAAPGPRPGPRPIAPPGSPLPPRPRPPAMMAARQSPRPSASVPPRDPNRPDRTAINAGRRPLGESTTVEPRTTKAAPVQTSTLVPPASPMANPSGTPGPGRPRSTLPSVLTDPRPRSLRGPPNRLGRPPAQR